MKEMYPMWCQDENDKKVTSAAKSANSRTVRAVLAPEAPGCFGSLSCAEVTACRGYVDFEPSNTRQGGLK